MTDIYNFNKYYDIPHMKAYFRVLALRGFIIPDREGTFHTKYKISATGIQVIEEIEEGFNSEMYEFSNKYHLDL
jgi:predicted transcriptional regulator